MEIDKKSSYINLRIGTEQFAISVFSVLEIIQHEQLTHVPNSSEFVLGVLNFRGSIVPVIDLNKRFNMNRSQVEGQMIVIVEVNSKDKTVLIGLLVDMVTDVIEFDYKSIQSVPDLGIKYNPEYIDGFIESEEKFIMVLNTDRVLNVQELSEINEDVTK
jgi:purine-binding chemotaxis protein CheW